VSSVGSASRLSYEINEMEPVIITKEMVDYSAMKSYLEKNNLHYFTFSPNSKKPIKAVICCLPPDMPVKDISNGPEDLGFNVINVRQMTA
jgi:hypothetical protein